MAQDELMELRMRLFDRDWKPICDLAKARRLLKYLENTGNVTQTGICKEFIEVLKEIEMYISTVEMERDEALYYLNKIRGTYWEFLLYV